ncbi:MAG: hypothetical protein HY049_06885 [Acidobacteria bacterium]|nr:hypothetical protein [Acidobacteriota bacterium]
MTRSTRRVSLTGISESSSTRLMLGGASPATEGSAAPAGGASLESLIERARMSEGVRRADLQAGDRLVVQTKNSAYSILVLGDGRYVVSGGWFDRKGVSPATVTINGCTFGTRAILTDLVAGRGLFIEFGNNVVTTRIRSFKVLRTDADTTVH